VALHHDLEGGRPGRAQPAERVGGGRQPRRAETSWELATGTLACPSCDAPVLPGPGAATPPDPTSCGFCSHAGPLRDFLSLGEPARPTRVVVRVRGLALS
jgi:hypothetical protein